MYLFAIFMVSALPLLITYLYLRQRLPQFGGWLFLASLSAGALSMLVASLIQVMLPAVSSGTRFSLVYMVFIRNALTEETGRFVVLVLVFWIVPSFYTRKQSALDRSGQLSLKTVVFIGVIAGFSFAMLENLSYGLLNPRLIVVRTLTSAPLHGACAARISLAAFSISIQRTENSPKQAAKGLFYGITAVLIHGVYNLLLIVPSVSAIFSILLAYIALASTLAMVKTERKDIK